MRRWTTPEYTNALANYLDDPTTATRGELLGQFPEELPAREKWGLLREIEGSVYWRGRVG